MHTPDRQINPDDFYTRTEDVKECTCESCGFTVEENRKDCRLCFDCEQNFLNNIEP